MGQSEDSGWIKLHRKIEQHWLYPSGRKFTEYEAWQDILLQVNHKPKRVRIKNKIMTCQVGQSIRSVKQWAIRWKWSKSKVYRFFDLLEQEGMIKTSSETVTTRLTVCKYDTYQSGRNADETEVKRIRNAGETTSDTNKNDKNDKNERNIYTHTARARENHPPGEGPAMHELTGYGDMHGIPPDECRAYWLKYEAKNWLKYDKSADQFMPIQNWKADLAYQHQMGWLKQSNKRSNDGNTKKDFKHGRRTGVSSQDESEYYEDALQYIDE